MLRTKMGISGSLDLVVRTSQRVSVTTVGRPSYAPLNRVCVCQEFFALEEKAEMRLYHFEFSKT